MTTYAMETILTQATAPGASGINFAAVTGNSLQVRDSGTALIIDQFHVRQASGFFRLTSPLMHDAIVGITRQCQVGRTWSSNMVMQVLTPQDTLVAAGSGSAVAGDIEQSAYTIYYEDLAGIDSRFLSAKDVMSRAEDIYSFNVSLAPGVVGGWSGTTLFTSAVDQLKANRDYAIIGIEERQSATVNTAFGLTSPDWGNLRIAVPASLEVELVSNYYLMMSNKLGISCVPVFNASQKSSLFVDVAANENGVPTVISINAVLLRGSGGKVSRSRSQ